MIEIINYLFCALPSKGRLGAPGESSVPLNDRLVLHIALDGGGALSPISPSSPEFSPVS